MTGTIPAVPTAARDDGAEQGPVDGEGGPGPLPGHLAGRAAEVEVDVVDADLVDQALHGRPMTVGSTPTAARCGPVSSAANGAMPIVLAFPSTRARAVIISLT